MAGTKIGEATVDVVADVSRFTTKLAARLREDSRSLDAVAKSLGKSIGVAIADGVVDGFARRLPATRAKLAAMLAAMRLKANVEVEVNVEKSRGILDEVVKRVSGNVKADVTGSLFSAFKSFGSLGKSGGLTGFLLTPQGAVAGIAAAAASGGALQGALTAAGREMLNLGRLAFLVPAGLSMAVASSLTLKIAFMGMEDALEAVFSKDPKKLEAALKGLSAPARAFVMNIKSIVPDLEYIQKTFQGKFFGNLVGKVQPLFDNLSSIMVVSGGKLADAFGGLVGKIADVFTTREAREFLKSLLDTTASIVNMFSGPVSHLVKSLMGVATFTMGFVEGNAQGGANMIEKFATWLDNIVKDGRLQKWLDDAKRSFDDVKYVIEQLIGLFGVMFDNANTEGESFIRIIGDMIKALKEFGKTEDGKLALEGMAALAKAAGFAFLSFASAVWIVVSAVSSLVGAVQRALQALGILEAKKNALSGEGYVYGNAASGAVGAFATRLKGYAVGGIVTSPTAAMIGEGGGPEVVIPLNRPQRAAQLVKQSGLDRIVGSGGGSTTQIFYLGTEQVDARIVSVTRGTINGAVREAAYGARG